MRRLLASFLLVSPLVHPQDKNPPAQPIPFSHKTHVALPLKCSDCHAMPDPGEVIALPAASKCMACHRTIKPDSPAIKELRAYAGQNRPIPWARVYEIPSWVYFSHKTHLDSGAKCESCHGPVAERDRLWRESDLSMRACMDCHRTHKATLDCGGCHELKN
jgi:Cytochrome c7 and related cytochrome c/Class III cytochrome C family